MRIPSRRALRHDDIFDAIIERLFPDVEVHVEKETHLRAHTSTHTHGHLSQIDAPQKFERDRAEIMESINKRFKVSGSAGPGSGPVGEPDAQPQEPTRRRTTTGARAQRLIAQESAKITSSSSGAVGSNVCV